MEEGITGAPAGMMQPEPQAEEESNVSPEEQAQYDQFVRNGMELLYTKEGRVLPEAVQRLATGKDPVNALASTAVWAVMMVQNSAEQSGAQISDDVLFHGGRELLEQLSEVAEAYKIHDFDEQDLQGAWYSALDMWREANTGGRFNPEAAKQEFVALNQAEAEGRAGEVLPGVSSVEELGDRAFSKLEDRAGG